MAANELLWPFPDNLSKKSPRLVDDVENRRFSKPLVGNRSEAEVVHRGGIIHSRPEMTAPLESIGR